MHWSRLSRRTATLAAAAMLAIAAFAATAAALSGGGPQLRMDNRDGTSITATGSTAWGDLAGSQVSAPVPAGESRLINARFTAESICNGPNAGYCSVRIVAQDTASGALVELDPAGGKDFIFDSDVPGSTDDRFEANAMERSRRLGPGTYRLRVQHSVWSASTYFGLDDWQFAVETSA